MKNLLIIFCLSFIACKSQQIIPWGTRGFPIENAYYKDINNELDPFLGTWKGTFQNRTFVITFSKYKNYNSMGNYYEDRLAGKYKMLDSNGSQLYSTYSLSDENAKVTSLGFVGGANKTVLRFTFGDLCIEGQIVLNFENTQKTQMHWTYYTEQTLVTDDTGCAVYNEMPRGEFTLTKQ